jgi:hypothetical protein
MDAVIDHLTFDDAPNVANAQRRFVIAAAAVSTLLLGGNKFSYQ